MLKEVKNEFHHYFIDDQGHVQGEYKRWWPGGRVWEHCFYVNGNIHGEYKRWFGNGKIDLHCFYVNGELHGEYKARCRNGKLWAHYFCVNGVKPHLLKFLTRTLLKNLCYST